MSVKRFLFLFIVILLLSGCATTQECARHRVSRAYSHYVYGLLYDNENNLNQAITEYEKALIYDPSSPSIHLRLGIDYIWKGEYSKAIEQFELALKYNSQDTHSRFLLALLYTSQKNLTQTIEQYKQIIQLEPESFKNNPLIFYNLGIAYLRTDKFELAIENFKKAAELRPQNAKLRLVLGLAYLEKKDYQAALKNFELAVQLSEIKFANDIYYFYLGVVYDKIGERKKAAENFKKAIILNPDNDSAYNYLGYMFAEDEINLDEAERLVKKAIEIEPRQGAYADSLGWVYYKKSLELKGQKAEEMLKKSLKEINRAIELMGDDPVVRDHLEDVKKRLRHLKMP